MWLVSFAKGPRSCIGIKSVIILPLMTNVSERTLTTTLNSLAYCELFLTFANLFRRFDMRLDGVRYVTVLLYLLTYCR